MQPKKMSKIYLSIILALVISTLHAQPKTASDYAKSITTDLLKQYLTVLTSDELAGRETATKGEKLAAKYVAKQFKKSKLKKFAGTKKFLQYYDVFRDTALSGTLTVGNQTFTLGDKMFMSTAASFSQTVTASDIVFVGYGITDSLYDDYANKDVKGKIVLYVSGEPMVDSTMLLTGSKRPSDWSGRGDKKLRNAQAHGAVAVLTFSAETPNMSDATKAAYKRPALKFKPAPASLNAATLPHSVVEAIIGNTSFAQILAATKARKKLNELVINTVTANTKLEYNESSKKLKARNTVGYIKGSEYPDEYVYITAHMDHLGTIGKDIYRGADDDGSGTSAVMALAKAFKDATKDGMRPKRSIIFMTVSGEEKGLWGSEYATDNPLVDHAKVSADINIDMVGRVDSKRTTADTLNYIYAVGSDKLSSEMRPIMEQVNNQYVGMVLDYKFDDPNDRERIYFRSDHYNFAKNGIPIVFFYNGSHADYHRSTDTIDKINFELMAKRAKLAFHLGWELANREKMLIRDLPLPKVSR
jgi:hypothetical protein